MFDVGITPRKKCRLVVDGRFQLSTAWEVMFYHHWSKTSRQTLELIRLEEKFPLILWDGTMELASKTKRNDKGWIAWHKRRVSIKTVAISLCMMHVGILSNQAIQISLHQFTWQQWPKSMTEPLHIRGVGCQLAESIVDQEIDCYEKNETLLLSFPWQKNWESMEKLILIDNWNHEPTNMKIGNTQWFTMSSELEKALLV